MEHIKYTIESLADINIHQGVTKDDISYFEIKEKNLPHTLINRNILKSIA